MLDVAMPEKIVIVHVWEEELDYETSDAFLSSRGMLYMLWIG